MGLEEFEGGGEKLVGGRGGGGGSGEGWLGGREWSIFRLLRSENKRSRVKQG